MLPQLRMMQKAKVVEKFTAHYVFALGLSRFISCAHWILQLVDGDSFLLQVRKIVSHALDIACQTIIAIRHFKLFCQILLDCWLCC